MWVKIRKELVSVSSKTKTVKILCFCAVFAAIICVCTLISIPMPIGYFNLGDVAVLLAAYLFGAWGAVAAAIGSALADIFLGFAIYAPATAIIKGLVALVAAWSFGALSTTFKRRKGDTLPLIISAVLGECIMVGGYFAYEALVLGYGLGALASVAGNATQAVCGAFGGVVLTSALKAVKADRFFKFK